MEHSISPSRADLLNAFTPAASVWDPSGFAGRRAEVLDLVDCLLTEASCPVICGDRGLGKTSLARQLERIAQGDVELLTRLNAPDRALGPDDRWVTFFLSCADWNDIHQVVRALIDEMIAFQRGERVPTLQVAKETIQRGIKFKHFEASITKELHPAAFPEPSAQMAFTSTVNTLFHAGVPRILFVIDELDRVKHRATLATFIKNNSNDVVKFLLVGLADSSAVLVDNHLSVRRQLREVHVEGLTDSDVRTIIRCAEERLEEAGSPFKFDQLAIRGIQDRVAGHPYYVHLIGQAALAFAADNNQRTITAEIVERAAKQATAQFASIYHDAYQKAIGADRELEVTLRVCAKFTQNVVRERLRDVAGFLRVLRVHEKLLDLQDVRRGSVLVPIANTEGLPLRFRDPLFKIYVENSQSLLPAVKAEVDDAWASM